VKLTTHPHLVPRLGTRGALTYTPLFEEGLKERDNSTFLLQPHLFKWTNNMSRFSGLKRLSITINFHNKVRISWRPDKSITITFDFN
jgi:hypothetical protein